MTEHVTRYYLRFEVKNSAGVLAEIAGALGSAGVSIEKMVQEEARESATLLMITHLCKEGALRSALAELQDSARLIGSPRFVRIEDI